jgi:protein-tyrosine phosphatase
MVRVLFVCTGNICRSPTAEGVFRFQVDAAGLGGWIEADSAGTHGYHVGEPPDSRTIRAAGRRGYRLEALRARQVAAADFADFDLILAMDRGHQRDLRRLAPGGGRAEIGLFLDYAPDLGLRDVPDPYYGGAQGFEQVLDLCEAGCRGLIAALGAKADRGE